MTSNRRQRRRRRVHPVKTFRLTETRRRHTSTQTSHRRHRLRARRKLGSRKFRNNNGKRIRKHRTRVRRSRRNRRQRCTNVRRCALKLNATTFRLTRNRLINVFTYDKTTIVIHNRTSLFRSSQQLNKFRQRRCNTTSTTYRNKRRRLKCQVRKNNRPDHRGQP